MKRYDEYDSIEELYEAYNIKPLSQFLVEDDAKEMVRIIESVFTEMVTEYLLNPKEAEKSIDKLSDKLTGKILKDMFASEDRKIFAQNLLTPIIENEVAKRRTICLPTEKEMLSSLKSVLEDIALESESFNKSN